MTIARLMTAVWAGKLTTSLSRVLGLGAGSTYPGKIIRQIDPQALAKLTRGFSQGTVMISGTNGKTTTSNMIAHILKRAGKRLAHNRAGANLITGLTASLVESCNFLARLRADIGLFEVDEATVPQASKEIKPQIMLVTNFFRDQLDRYGELDYTASLIRRSLPNLALGGRILLNADDPLVANLGQGIQRKVLYYGIEDESLSVDESIQAADVKYCVSCGDLYDYGTIFYGHLGKYQCQKCGNARPIPHIYANNLEFKSITRTAFQVNTPQGEFGVEINLPGLYNVYNALAAIGCSLMLGLKLEEIKEGLESFHPAFGRMEQIKFPDNQALLILVKNPTGFNEVLRTMLIDQETKNLLICINDNYADGEDISWLWDVDFEGLLLAKNQIRFALTAGIRGEDMALRLKYAGLDPQKIEMGTSLKDTLEIALHKLEEGENLYILSTYTAMLEMRDIIQKKGYLKKYWEA